MRSVLKALLALPSGRLVKSTSRPGVREVHGENTGLEVREPSAQISQHPFTGLDKTVKLNELQFLHK